MYCRRLPELSISVAYHMPKYIMSRYISMTMQYAASRGPELLLRMPRVVSFSHLLWGYLNDDDLLAIQKLYAEGKASPYDVNTRGSNALIYSVGRNYPELSQFLSEQGADPDLSNDTGRTPSNLLWECSFAGKLGSEGISVIGSMLRDTEYVQTQCFSTLHNIVLGIFPQDLKSELGISVAKTNIGDSNSRTPWCWAIIRNDLQAVKTLLVFGANPNIVDIWGHTPLGFLRSIGVCKALLDAGVNAHSRNTKYSRTVLHQLHKRGDGDSFDSERVEIIDSLVAARIDVDVRDSDQEMPLLNALYSGHIAHARGLIDLGADVNASNLSSRESAIHFAVIFSRHEKLSLLLERGADYTAVNVKGKNIAHMAAGFAGTNIISVLAKSNLVKLDVSVRSKDGKTPADYLSERSILTESEHGLHAEFERFMRSIPVPVPGGDTANGTSKATVVGEWSDACSSFHVPGAYPMSADHSIPL